MGKCNINLAVTFDSTADTDRLRAVQIAERVRNFLAVELDAANMRVEVHGAALNYTEAYRAARDESIVAERQYPSLGNPEKDWSN